MCGPYLPLVGLALRANLATPDCAAALGRLCPPRILPGPRFPLSVVTLFKSVLCTPYSVIFSASHFSTFAPASPPSSVLPSASYLAFSNDRSASSFSVGIRVR